MLKRCTLGVALTVATPASADIFKLFGQVEGGGMYGQGTAGEAKDSDFFKASPHGVYGAEIGAELFFIDAWISHHQFTNGDRITTWTKFGLGMHFEIDFAKPAPPPSQTKDENGKPKPKPKKDDKKEGQFFEIGLGLFGGLGTGQQVDPPLDNSEITDKALLIEGRLGLGKHVNNVLDVGVLIPVSYGYFIKNGADVVANDLDNHYRGVQGEVLLYLRVNARIL